MVLRIWHGWTTPENAPKYETLLKNEILPAIAAKGVTGYKGIQLSKRTLEGEVEFVTIMRFEAWEAVKDFAGDNYEHAYVPEKARQVLARFDSTSQHYEVLEDISYSQSI